MPIDLKSREILREALKNRTPVLISGDGLDITSQTYLANVEGDHILIANKIKPELITPFVNSKNFALMVNMIRFQSKEILSDGKNMIFPLKEDSLIQETRQAERFSFSPDEHVICEFLNPFDGETRISKPVLDMSATGLSIRTHFDSALFQARSTLPDLKVLIDREIYTQGVGETIYRRKMLDLKGKLRLQVGIKFVGRS